MHDDYDEFARSILNSVISMQKVGASSREGSARLHEFLRTQTTSFEPRQYVIHEEPELV